MEQDQIQWLQRLDKDGTNGTVQTILLNPELHKLDFLTVLKYLLETSLREKEAILKEHQCMWQYLKKHGLDTAEAIGVRDE
nr:MAG TPA: hypothetical protein [Caudoviricetes sp.]